MKEREEKSRSLHPSEGVTNVSIATNYLQMRAYPQPSLSITIYWSRWGLNGNAEEYEIIEVSLFHINVLPFPHFAFLKSWWVPIFPRLAIRLIGSQV